jgi:hypothetical protein
MTFWKTAMVMTWLLAATLARGQSDVDNTPPPVLVITCAQNKAWLDSLGKQPLAQQLQMVTDRVVLDTNVIVNLPNADRARERMTFRREGCCKPLFALDGYLITFNQIDPSKDVAIFLSVFSQVHIVRVEVHTDLNVSSLYGSEGDCGLVLLVVKDKASRKLIKETYRHMK